MESRRIKLINCDEALINIIFKGDDQISKELGINVPDGWTEFGRGIFGYSLQKIKEDPDHTPWGSYLTIELDGNILVGSCGYKGMPDSNGVVEIGYEIAKDYRNKGYATEVTNLLVEKAFRDSRVKQVLAHTLPEENASVKVLKKNGFKFVNVFEDVEDGLVWRWLKVKL